MEKFILKNKNGRPVFIQQKGNLTKPTVRLTPHDIPVDQDAFEHG